MTAADAAGAQYNLIEAFDQPWKRLLEGTVGGAWGFFDADRVQKVFTKGPVTEWPDAPLWARITSYNVCYTKLLRAEPGAS